MNRPRPHDLLRIAPVNPLSRGGPPWVGPALRWAPWVVVRRDRCAPGHVAVGIRGSCRSQRHPTIVDLDTIVECLSPADLLERADQLPDVPAAHALRAAAGILEPSGVVWGPGGSTGFTLATGVPVVTADSDLDLVISADRLPSRDVLLLWYNAFRDLPARVDCQLDLPVGGVALAELIGDASRVLLRTADGPALVPRDGLPS
jgi:phosphoribosyl-dephospho-CoA transferase